MIIVLQPWPGWLGWLECLSRTPKGGKFESQSGQVYRLWLLGEAPRCSFFLSLPFFKIFKMLLKYSLQRSYLYLQRLSHMIIYHLRFYFSFIIFTFLKYGSFFIFFLKILKLILREREGEGETEREKNTDLRGNIRGKSIGCLLHTPYRVCSGETVAMCPDWELNDNLSVHGKMSNPRSHTSQGWQLFERSDLTGLIVVKT